MGRQQIFDLDILPVSRSSLQEDAVLVEPLESGGCSNKATVTAISRQSSTQKVIVLAEDTGIIQGTEALLLEFVELTFLLS